MNHLLRVFFLLLCVSAGIRPSPPSELTMWKRPRPPNTDKVASYVRGGGSRCKFYKSSFSLCSRRDEEHLSVYPCCNVFCLWCWWLH